MTELEKITVEDVIMYRNQSVVTIKIPRKPIWTGDYVRLEGGKCLRVAGIPMYNNPASLPKGRVDIILDGVIKKNDILYY